MSGDTPLLGDITGQLDIPVGYTDPVIAVSSWPQTTTDFTVTAAEGGGATLSVQLAMQTGGLIPAPTEAGTAAALRAVDLHARFARIYYQVLQPDVTAKLSTTLNASAGSGPVLLDAAVAPVHAQAAAACAFAWTASQLATAPADPAHAATLADMVTWYGLDWTALAAANAETVIGGLIDAAQVAIPVYAVFQAGDTVAGVVPQGGDPAAVLGDPDNVVLPLMPGTELVIPSRTITPDAALSLNAIATANVVTSASLVSANATTTALLRPGFVFRAQGVEVEVPATSPAADITLDDVALTFRDNGVPYDAVMAAVASGDAPGMFRDGVHLAFDRYVIQQGETLAENDSGATTAQLVPINTATVDLFPAGAPLFLDAPPTAAPIDTPLGEAASAYAVQAGEILRHNAGAPAVSGGPAVPGMSKLPATPADLRVPYRIPGGTALGAIAALFLPADPDKTPAQGLVTANAALPDTVAGGQTIVVAGQSLTTAAGDSFADVIAPADPPVTLDQLADAIADDPDALAAGGLLLCPPGKLAAGATTPAAAGARYGVEPAALLNANSATPGLIVAGQVLQPSLTAPTPTVTTVGGDTLNAIVRRFAMLEVATTVDALAQANLDVAFLAGDALLLLPPPARTVAATFGAAGWLLPDTIFPVQAWLAIERDRDLVDPAFRGPAELPGSAVRAVTAVAARRSAAPERQEDGAITLNEFARLAEEAIPGLRIATGKVLASQRTSDATDVWAVSFVDPGGITQVAIAPPVTVPSVEGPQPRSFALRPLSNVAESRSGLEIKLLDPSTGSYGETVTLDYQGIDLEVWARSFLADLDLFFTAPYAAPAYTVARAALETAIGAKADLAGAVADGLSLVLDIDQGAEIGSPNWSAAREALRQQLLVELSRAYATAAVIQFEADVTAPLSSADARLSGAGRILALLDAPGEDADPGAESWRKAALSNAKTPLGAGSWPVSFALSLPDEARHRAVALDLAYAVNEVEFDIHPVVEGYDASNWLSFVHPLDQPPPPALDVDLGQPLVPIPLRSYPPLAALASQQALTADAPADVESAVHWSYVFVYRHQSAAQDQIRVEIDFNLRPQARALAAEIDDLFGRLAQYAAIAPTLWPLLAGLPDPALVDQTVVANAVATYAGLVREVADAWDAHWGVTLDDAPDDARATLDPPAPSPPPTGAPFESYGFRATLAATDVADPTYTTLTLERLVAGGTVEWPSIVVIKPDGVRVALTPGTAAGEVLVYDFPPDEVPAFVALGFEMTFAHLHIARYQNASARVWVERNALLLGVGGPPTRPPFVYRTPAMAFAEPLVPLINVDARIDIGPWTYDPATNPLGPVFETIFDGDPVGRQIAVAIRYGYSLAPGPDPIEAYLPVALHPRYTYSGLQPIIDAVDDWRRINQPVSTGGLWAFAINLYSSLDTTLDRPLLTLNRLVSPIATE